MEKLLPPDIAAKEAEKENETLWSNPSDRMPPPSTSDQTDNLRRLKLFPPFVSFRLDVEDRRRMLDPKLRKKEFLKSLYGKNHHKEIPLIAKEILQAKMNFTHFVPSSEPLSPGLFPNLCHDLLRRSAALQLCENQVTYNQLIPIYFGNQQGTVERSQCGVILI